MAQNTRHSDYLNHKFDTCQGYMRSLCETSIDAILVFDQTGRIACMNRVAEELFGYDAYSIIEQPVNVLLPSVTLDPASGDYLTQMTTGCTSTQKTLHVELMITSFYEDDSLYHLAIVRDMSGDTNIGEMKLSPRQRQVLKLVVQGFTSREIAEKLTISIKTVETHRANIMNKLSVRNVSSLVRYAVETGII